MADTGDVGAILRNFEPGSGDHVHAHPHQHPDGSTGGEMHSHGHDHAHDRDAYSDGGHGGTGVGMANGYEAVELAEAGGMDLSGLDATPDEVAALLDVLSEPGMNGYGGYDPDQHAADWASSLSDAEFAELEAAYQADRHLPGPELAGADTGGVVDLAGSMSDIDSMLAAMTDREHQRQVQDAAEQDRRSGPHHRRPTAEIKLAAAMRRLDAGSYVYGQQPAGADLAADPAIDDLFSTGPSLNALEVRDQMRYQLLGGAKPQGRGEFLPPVKDLATRIGLR